MHWTTSHWAGLLVAATLLMATGRCQQLTAEEKASTLQFANHLRRNTVPKAADMNGLLWDTTLENLAQRAANSCLFQHNYNGEYATLGETLYRGGNRNFSHILMFMFLERENYNDKTGQCTPTKYPFFSTCGHYLQIASAGVNKIGCGIQLCSGVYLAACEFDRQYTSPPYRTGEPGTKCGNGYATYYKDGLCYAIMFGQTPPVPGPFECKLSCLNYGTLMTSPICYCSCPMGYFGVRCETPNPYYVTGNSNCTAQAVKCANGGTPTMIDATQCKCVCPAKFAGDNCEENVEQMNSSILIYFGGQTIYDSYYPTNVTLWNATELRNSVRRDVTSKLNSYCIANFTSCCPNSATNQTVETFVTEADFYDTDNYPAQDIDGTLVAAIHYRLNATVAMLCNYNTSVYVTKAALKEAWSRVESGIKLLATEVGLVIARIK